MNFWLKLFITNITINVFHRTCMYSFFMMCLCFKRLEIFVTCTTFEWLISMFCLYVFLCKVCLTKSFVAIRTHSLVILCFIFDQKLQFLDRISFCFEECWTAKSTIRMILKVIAMMVNKISATSFTFYGDSWIFDNITIATLGPNLESNFAWILQVLTCKLGHEVVLLYTWSTHPPTT